MTISMYQTSVPVFIRMLNNLAAILQKAAIHAETKKIDPVVLINFRLYPDMLRTLPGTASGGSLASKHPSSRITKRRFRN